MCAGIRPWARQVLRNIAEDWYKESGSLVGDALVDFPPLRELSQQVTASAQTRSDAESCLDSLIKTAHDAMAQIHKRRGSTDRWRQLYTDACILRSIADILDAEDENLLGESKSVASIGRLDRAIIIAGPYGQGRSELIIEFISRIQLHTQWNKQNTASSFPSLDLNVPQAPRSQRIQRPPLPRSIKRIDTSVPPSLSAFASYFSKEPFVLSGYVKDWPAMTSHPWHSLDYLKKVAGPARVVPVEVGSDYRAEDWTQCLMQWDEFLDSLCSSSSDHDLTKTTRQVLYLAQHDLFRQFPSLRDDIVLPDYVYAAPEPPENYPDYRPPANDDQLVVNAWLGPAGTISPAHTDPFFNMYAQVVGRKTVWLSSPESTAYMYPYSTTNVLGNVQEAHVNPAANNVEPSMCNTSRVDVFAPGDAQFSLFSQHVTPQALCVTLEPGDLLFFPPGWWHAMRSEETSFSVSMWF